MRWRRKEMWWRRVWGGGARRERRWQEGEEWVTEDRYKMGKGKVADKGYLVKGGKGGKVMEKGEWDIR